MRDMTLTNSQRLVVLALKAGGPMTDSQLAWMLRRFELTRAQVHWARRQLVRLGRVRFTHKAKEVYPGHLSKLWEAAVR